ncbi:MAG: D-alanyl-D-alanine carboxypeptidase [Fimbriimonadaceae bacterium]|nr:D-alanyl-D-alanine carboxypeptidase [Fimbriimonadaceae bacterium]
MVALLLSAPQTRPLDAILDDERLRGAIVAARVEDAEGNVLFSRNDALRVMPASNQKLLTGAFALAQLGTAYRPVTKFWKARGKIIIESPGDPLFRIDELRRAKSALRVSSRTPVYLVQAYRPGIPENWEVGDLPNKYAAPISAFTVDRASVTLVQQAGRLELRPAAYGLRIVREGSEREPFAFRYDPFTREVRYRGKPGTDFRSLDTLALPDADQMAANFIGRYRPEPVEPPTREPDFTIMGGSLPEHLGNCLQPSDNNIAEHLLLMASKPAQGPATYPVARRAIETWLTTTVGIERGDVRVDDGSGLSRHNLVTARAITRLLRWCAEQPTRATWCANLAKPGVGTLSSRLEGIAFDGKTGSLDAVSALSGYVYAPNGREYRMSLIMNHYRCATSDARALQDEFVRAISSRS